MMLKKLPLPPPPCRNVKTEVATRTLKHESNKPHRQDRGPWHDEHPHLVHGPETLLHGHPRVHHHLSENLAQTKG